MGTPVLIEMRPVAADVVDAKHRTEVFEEACRAVTACFLVDLEAAFATDNCSALVDPASMEWLQTFDGDAVRLNVRGVNLHAYLHTKQARECCTQYLSGYVVERVAVDSDQRAVSALVAIAALLLVVLVVLALKRFWERSKAHAQAHAQAHVTTTYSRVASQSGATSVY